MGFDEAVGPSGYRWWYIDALSDDGRYGLAVIGLVGSVFSPYYARARAKGETNPERHCAMNVVLYGRGSKRWAMTERGAGDLKRSSDELVIGPSSISGDASGLIIKIDEVTVPWLSRMRGEIRISFDALQQQRLALDDGGQHYWWPIAPTARATVAMKQPDLRWQGHAYIDSNGGSIPLEDTFDRWDWSRAQLADGSAVVLYAPQQIDGEAPTVALRFRPNAAPQPLQDVRAATLPSTPIWRIPRGTLVDSDAQPQIQKTLEDTPFYARSVLQTRLLGETSLAMHESLSLSRFRQPWVKLLLPFRMPRRGQR
ncbi:MAG: carotenoid 1,2-hydratase [Pseudomonadota bacterium]